MSGPAAIEADQWLSGVMHRPVFRLHPDFPGPLASIVAEHAGGQRDAFYYVKVPSGRTELVRQLCGLGFFVPDVNLTFERPSLDPPPSSAAESVVTVRPVEPGDEDGAVAVAGSAFRFSRFHLDPLVAKDTADEIKRQWVRSYCAGRRGDRLFVALDQGQQPVGFLAAMVAEGGGARRAVIDLVGVSPAQQGRQIGRALVRAFLEHYRASCSAALVGTQVANVPSCRFYEALGFRLVKSDYVLHKHVARLGDGR